MLHDSTDIQVVMLQLLTMETIPER